jgi:cytochrome c556
MRLKTWFGALALLALAGTALAQADVITERRAGFKRAGEAMDQMKAVVENKGDPRPFVRQIDEMATFFAGMPKLFPAGSDKGDTKAKPEIWQNFSDFEAIDNRLVAHLKLLRNAAEAGDVAAFEAAYKATGPQFCGACHRPYRNR